jgi:DnaK suppressor protein
VNSALKRVRKYLEGDRKSVLQELGSIAAGSNEEMHEGSPSGNKEEAAIAYSEFERRSAHKRNVEERLVDVDRALDKIEKGTYGLCDCCGRPIPPARMEAIPQTNLCMDCKARMRKSPAESRFGMGQY